MYICSKRPPTCDFQILVKLSEYKKIDSQGSTGIYKFATNSVEYSKHLDKTHTCSQEQ